MKSARTTRPASRAGRLTKSPALLAAVLLSACALAPKLEPPTLSIVDVQVVSAELWMQHLKVRLHVHNPNDRELPVKGLSYTIYVNGEEAAHGVSDKSFIVPALGEAEFDMHVTANMAGTVLGLLARGGGAPDRIDYRVAGKVELSSGFMRSIPFDRRGTFSLR